MIWLAYNGWMGNGPVAVIVEAETEEEARAATIDVLLANPGTHAGDPDWAVVKTIWPLTLPFLGEIE